MSFSWKTFPKPIVALAPMSGVSDIAMRSIAKQWGSDITFSEFISSDALYYKVRSYYKNEFQTFTDEQILVSLKDQEYWKDDKSFVLAKFIEQERPFIIQLFGNNPDHFTVATKILNYLFKPDGFDINFGCPARSVVNNGAGSCLFLQPELAKQIISAVKEASNNLPTSIKLRASYKHIPAIEFLNAIEGSPYENITIHMRTYEQVHHGEPNWDSGKLITEYAHSKGISCIINGGIDSGTKAKEALEYTKADGVMVAQSSLGNPFIFKEIKEILAGNELSEITNQIRAQTALTHAKLMLEYKGTHGIVEMRKHLAWYFKGFKNASELRQQLVKVETIEQLKNILHHFVIQSEAKDLTVDNTKQEPF